MDQTTTPTPTPGPVEPTAPRTLPGRPAPAPVDHLLVRPWIDPVVDQVGHDPRSTYVERFWLATLGPSTTWLLRRLAAGLEAEPEGFTLDLDATARALGLGSRRGANAPFARALERSRQFRLARDLGDGVLAVRRKLPPLSRHQVARLPLDLQAAHQQWLEGALPGPGTDEQRRRARRLALSLAELGEDREGAERQLHQWRFHPAMAHEAVAWAWDRHRVAAKAAAR
ncbi:MAG: hypothetical protein KDG44_03255, partial [Burkholderiaceae bacterium]|nr:hypothetical protein [Burkholderiaceae bacterium]